MTYVSLKLKNTVCSFIIELQRSCKPCCAWIRLTQLYVEQRLLIGVMNSGTSAASVFRLLYFSFPCSSLLKQDYASTTWPSQEGIPGFLMVALWFPPSFSFCGVSPEDSTYVPTSFGWSCLWRILQSLSQSVSWSVSRTATPQLPLLVSFLHHILEA